MKTLDERQARMETRWAGGAVRLLKKDGAVVELVPEKPKIKKPAATKESQAGRPRGLYTRERIATELGLEIKCAKCKEFWPATTEYYTISNGNIHPWCKACFAEYRANKRAEEKTAAPVPDVRLITKWSSRTVVLHDGQECSIPRPFFDYYMRLGLLCPVGRMAFLTQVRPDLKAEVDKVNGGLRFWVLTPEPIEPYRLGSNYAHLIRTAAAYMEEGSQPGWSEYDLLQLAFRRNRKVELATAS